VLLRMLPLSRSCRPRWAVPAPDILHVLLRERLADNLLGLPAFGYRKQPSALLGALAKSRGAQRRSIGQYVIKQASPHLLLERFHGPPTRRGGLTAVNPANSYR
jgi:hypothetical protein